MKEIVLKELMDFALAGMRNALRRTKADLRVSTEDLEKALDSHLRLVRNWSDEISFADLKSPKALEAVYIPLDTYLSPLRYRVSPSEPIKVVPLEEAISATLRQHGHRNDTVGSSTSGDVPKVGATVARHLVILGQPGAGKTTSMKSLCRRMLLDTKFLAGTIEFPVLVRLRELNPRESARGAETRLGRDDVLVARLQEILGIRLSFPPDLQTEEASAQRRSIRDRIVLDYIDSLRVLLILDGFDEIATKFRRENILAEIRLLAQQFDRSRLIVTSRTGEFNYHIENTQQYEISPLSEQQVTSFTRHWLGPSDGDRLALHVKRSPFADTALRPLTLAHLCAIYERTGSFPEKPKTVYNKIVNLLIENWDEQRSIRRESAYAHFGVYRKFEFLTSLAYVLTTAFKSSAFRRMDLELAYDRVHENFGLPKGDAPKVASELETHTGLFVQSGYNLFEFSHRSLQEYLTAEFIVRLPSVPKEPRVLISLPNELAIAVAISSQPSAYFAHLVFARFPMLQAEFPFIRAFVNRLLVEQPDFEKSTRAGCALLTLYSQYLRSTLHHPAQMSIFVMDRLGEEFGQLGKLIRERIVLGELLNAFDTISTPTGLQAERILQLVKRPKAKRQITQNFAQNIRDLPNEIWINETLVEPNDKGETTG